jgi:hypothetical protein
MSAGHRSNVTLKYKFNHAFLKYLRLILIVNSHGNTEGKLD